MDQSLIMAPFDFVQRKLLKRRLDRLSWAPDLVITIPGERTDRRSEAIEFFMSRLPDDLQGEIVLVDGTGIYAWSPSYLDEMVKQVLVERDAKRLIFAAAHGDPFFLVISSCMRRGVDDRLDLKWTAP